MQEAAQSAIPAHMVAAKPLACIQQPAWCPTSLTKKCARVGRTDGIGAIVFPLPEFTLVFPLPEFALVFPLPEFTLASCSVYGYECAV